MKRLIPLALVAACYGKYQAPPPVASIALPDGSQLKPYNPAEPGQARPQGMAQAAGRVYVTLSNQRDTSNFPVNAGPGFLIAIVPATGDKTLIDLGGTDGHQCQNPGFVRAAHRGDRTEAYAEANFTASMPRNQFDTAFLPSQLLINAGAGARLAGPVWLDVEAKNLLDDRRLQDLFQYPLPGLSLAAIVRVRL